MTLTRESSPPPLSPNRCPEFWSCLGHRVIFDGLLNCSLHLFLKHKDARGTWEIELGYWKKSHAAATLRIIFLILWQTWMKWLSVQPAEVKHFRRKHPADNTRWCSGDLKGLWGHCGEVSVSPHLSLLCVLLCLGLPHTFKSVEIVPTPMAGMMIHR